MSAEGDERRAAIVRDPRFRERVTEAREFYEALGVSGETRRYEPMVQIGYARYERAHPLALPRWFFRGSKPPENDARVWQPIFAFAAKEHAARADVSTPKDATPRETT